MSFNFAPKGALADGQLLPINQSLNISGNTTSGNGLSNQSTLILRWADSDGS